MRWQEVWRQLEEKQVAPCYLLAGEERYLIQQTVAKIEKALQLGELKALNSERVDAAAIDGSRLAAAVAQAPWLARRRLVVVRGLNPAASKKKSAARQAVDLWERLPSIIESLSPAVCLVLCLEGDIDKRTKVAKAVAQKGELVRFSYLSGREREQWIRRRGQELGLSWERGALSYLNQRVAWSLAQLEQELEKLAAYAKDGEPVSRSQIKLLVPESRESRVFALTDAELAKNQELALSVLAELLLQGEQPISLVGLLAHQVRMVGLAKAAVERGVASQLVAKEVKMHPYVARKAVAQSQRFSWNELHDLVRRLATADWKLKSTGLPAKLVLEEVILLS